MALEYNDITAWIAMDIGLEVYTVEKIQPNHISCWIASIAGKKFSVNWRNATRAIPLQGTVIIDGRECDSHIMLDAVSFPDRHNSVGISFARTSAYTQRDFMFTAIPATDDNAYLDTGSQDHPFGTITLEIYRLEVLNVVSQPSLHASHQTLESQTVHELSIKAGAHHVSYGEEYYSPSPIVDIVSGRRTDAAPYVTFTFKYRPYEMLMADGIIPRPRELKFVLDRDTEIRQLEERINKLRSKGSSSQASRRTNPYPVAGGSRSVTKQPKSAKLGGKPKGAKAPTKVIDLIELN